ncbi:hypothetical protein [Argonema antarcticum]|uniref:hypothetical protein n=1 Tax=Argonema antarcticum TaxID=2942763 RepID=UPI002012EC19|nr:hypothetical protein [Argonema antarcticum]
MKIQGRHEAKIIPWIAIASALATMNFLIPPPGKAQTSGEFKIHCMSRIMYSANRRRSEITESAALVACQNATTPEQSLAIGDCLKDTMYNSSGAIRDGMSATAAATVCQRATNIISSQQISKCMRNTMYDTRSRLRQGMTANQAVRQCSRS